MHFKYFFCISHPFSLLQMPSAITLKISADCLILNFCGKQGRVLVLSFKYTIRSAYCLWDCLPGTASLDVHNYACSDYSSEKSVSQSARTYISSLIWIFWNILLSLRQLNPLLNFPYLHGVQHLASSNAGNGETISLRLLRIVIFRTLKNECTPSPNSQLGDVKNILQICFSIQVHY